MTPEKLKALVVYQNKLKERLKDPTPSKHVGHPESYRAYLNNELRIVTNQIEDAKLAAQGGK